ncbi:hypothetical protein [Nocardia callitridis]|uniref:Transmembrane protein n=1 Tax=Nocardia callitridis TaxID=648753 RepID=A0ABP9K5I2_9NOCA
MNTGAAVMSALIFVWLGMVLAISFLETPLKFRAPDVTLRIGLGIGRLIFRALNIAEVVLALAILITAVVDTPDAPGVIATAVAVVVLLVQLVAVRPGLTKRSDAVLAGLDAPRSNGHWVYVGLEVVKVVALLVAGIVLLAS